MRHIKSNYPRVSCHIASQMPRSDDGTINQQIKENQNEFQPVERVAEMQRRLIGIALYRIFSRSFVPANKIREAFMCLTEWISRYIELSMSPNCRDYCIYTTCTKRKPGSGVVSTSSYPQKSATLPVIIVFVVVFVSISVNVISFLHILNLMAIRPLLWKYTLLHAHTLNTDYLCVNEFSAVGFFCCLSILSISFDWFVKHLSAQELLYAEKMENERKWRRGRMRCDLKW